MSGPLVTVAHDEEAVEHRKSDEQLQAEVETELARPGAVRVEYRDTGKWEVVE